MIAGSPFRREALLNHRSTLPAALCTVIAALAGCSGGPGQGPPQHDSCVLLTVDTLRGDSIGAGGHPDVRTPSIDRLFRRSAQFSQAFSSSATTLASHTSLMTGAWPTTHGVLRNTMKVPESAVTLAEMLDGTGVTTAAFVSSVALAPETGVAQGFDVFDFRPARTEYQEQPWRPAWMTLRQALAWWRSTTGRRFLWVHLFEPHFPYEPRAALTRLYDPGYTGSVTGDMHTILKVWGDANAVSAADRDHLRALYHAEITGVDREIGKFLREIERTPRTAVVLTADHGESLGEHDLHFKHGPNLYPGDVGVPLAVRAEGISPTIVAALVRMIDVPAAMLALLGVDAELPAEADDVLRWTRESGEGLSVFAIASQPWSKAPDARELVQRAVRTPRATYVETPWRGKKEWYDRAADPGEDSPLDPERSEAAQALRAALRAWFDGAAEPGEALDDPRLLEQLESLGYVQ